MRQNCQRATSSCGHLVLVAALAGDHRHTDDQTNNHDCEEHVPDHWRRIGLAWGWGLDFNRGLVFATRLRKQRRRRGDNRDRCDIGPRGESLCESQNRCKMRRLHNETIRGKRSGGCLMQRMPGRPRGMEKQDGWLSSVMRAGVCAPRARLATALTIAACAQPMLSSPRIALGQQHRVTLQQVGGHNGRMGRR